MIILKKNYSVYNDIYKFVKKVINNFKINISFDFIKLLEEKEENDLRDLSLKIIKKVLILELDDCNNLEDSEDIKNNEKEDFENKQLNEESEKDIIMNNNKDDYDDIFDLDKNIKFNKHKKLELTDFYVLNEDLLFNKQLKKHKKK